MRLAAPAAALAVLLLPAAALAAECPKTSLSDLEDEVMCLVCGTPLALVDDEPQAQQQRELIRELVSDCRSKDEIKAVLVDEFGAEILALPGDGEDDNLSDVLVYLIPALALLLAAGGIVLALRRWRRRPVGETDGHGEVAPASGAATARLDADIERYEL
jgi:cytochrome c-type biogenesis protein CcmH/NrfF